MSKKLGKAVIRNRVKRYVREFYRTHKKLIDKGDIAIIARKDASELDYGSLCKELEILFSIRSSVKG